MSGQLGTIRTDRSTAAPDGHTGGERRQRDRGALGVPERPRPGHEQLGGQRRVVGCDAVAVERREREYLVAGRDAGDAGSDL